VGGGYKKWFKRWGVEDLLELPIDVMQHVIIEERLMESLKVKWKDARKHKLEYYVSNINPKCWIQYSERMHINHVQPYLIMSLSSLKALTVLRTRSHKLGIEIASWHQSASRLKSCKIYNQDIIEDEYHFLLPRIYNDSRKL
jgi:hypothetical protein